MKKIYWHKQGQITQRVILTLGIRGRLHTAGSLAERVREVDVSFSHDRLVQGRKLSDHLWHGLLQQVLLFTLLHILFTETWHTVKQSVDADQVGRRQLYVVYTRPILQYFYHLRRNLSFLPKFAQYKELD